MPLLGSIGIAAGIVAGIAGGGYVLKRILSRAVKAFDRAFRDRVLRDAAAWLSGKLDEPAASLSDALTKMADTGEADTLLERLVRVECTIEKRSATTAEVTVAVALREGDDVAVGKIASEVAWVDLPSDVRRKFIRQPDEAQCFDVVERAPGAKDGQADGA